MAASIGSWFTKSATWDGLTSDRTMSRSTSGWMIGIGILMAITGIIALMNTFAATLATVFILSIYLFFGGVMNLIDAFLIRRWNLALLDVVVAVIYFVGGWFAIRQPIVAAATVTIVLAAIFIIGGALRIVAALAIQPTHWGWLLFNGIVTLGLGILLFTGLPLTGLMGPGLLVGVDLLFGGVTAAALGFAARRAQGHDTRHEGRRDFYAAAT